MQLIYYFNIVTAIKIEKKRIAMQWFNFLLNKALHYFLQNYFEIVAFEIIMYVL